MISLLLSADSSVYKFAQKKFILKDLCESSDPGEHVNQGENISPLLGHKKKWNDSCNFT